MDVTITTVPLCLEQDRPFIDLTVTGPGGRSRVLRTWLDTGGGALIVTEAVARDLGLTWSDPSPHAPDFAPVDIPKAAIGEFELDLTGARSLVQLNGPIDAGVLVDAFVPGHVLARHHVIFDYPNRTFTVARPGLLAPRGVAVSTPFTPRWGFPRLEVEIDGERHGLLLDTGATCTMISTRLLTALTERHPDWPKTTGAAGVANMVGEADAQMPLVRIPQMAAGDLRFEAVLVVGRPPGNFERSMSQWMSAPIVGALAGNALKQFRVEIDYANQTTYFERLTGPDPDDCDQVGVILQACSDGGFTLTGTARSCGYPEAAIQPGDRLLAVDGHPVLGLSRPEVLAGLRGAPGEVRRLTIERRGDVVEVSLPVVKLI